jgi:hypothetical protein
MTRFLPCMSDVCERTGYQDDVYVSVLIGFPVLLILIVIVLVLVDKYKNRA